MDCERDEEEGTVSLPNCKTAGDYVEMGERAVQ